MCRWFMSREDLDDIVKASPAKPEDALAAILEDKAKTPEGRRRLLEYAAAYVRSKAHDPVMRNVARVMQIVSEQGCSAKESPAKTKEKD